MFKNKFDYLFIKNKVLNNALEQVKYSISLLYSEEGVVQGQEQAAISKALSKQIAWDLGKGVRQGIKFVKAQRKKMIREGLINPKDEMLQFMYEIGVYNPVQQIQEETPPEPAENAPTDPETPAMDEQTTEQQETPSDKPENEPKPDETTANEGKPKKPKRGQKKAKQSTEASSQGAGSVLSAIN